MSKSKLIEALHGWVRQRPGLEFCNYGDLSTYRSEMRSITKDRHHAEALLRYVELRDSITAEMILEASRRAFSGRLTIEPVHVQNSGYYGLEPEIVGYSIQYCTGQYFPTEYRKAVCAVLSSAIWDWLRDNMPPSDGMVTIDIGGKPLEIESHRGQTPGDYLRAAARRELGRPIASRWFQ